MSAASHRPNEQLPSSKVVDVARNEKQKSVLLQEAARLGQRRSSRAVEKSRELCRRAQQLQSEQGTRKTG